MAPEFWLVDYERDYSEKIDIWAFGIIAYKLFSGHYPFPGRTKVDLEE